VRQRTAIADERTSILTEVIRRLGIQVPPKTKGFKQQDLMQLLTLYEWKIITEKDASDLVWSSPCPWREASGFDVTPPEKG
jgi:hypothetical protein